MSADEGKELPRSAQALVKKLEGWSYKTPWGTGERIVKIQGLDEHKRPATIEALITVESVTVRARHIDGRAFIASWVRLEHVGKWEFDGAWRTWHADERAGLVIEISSAEANAYAKAEDLPAALVALEAERVKAAEAAQRRAAKAAAKKAAEAEPEAEAA